MRRQSFWSHRFTRTRIKSEKVQLPEMLFGYILGPMGASISGSNAMMGNSRIIASVFHISLQNLG